MDHFHASEAHSKLPAAEAPEAQVQWGEDNFILGLAAAPAVPTLTQLQEELKDLEDDGLDDAVETCAPGCSRKMCTITRVCFTAFYYCLGCL